MTEMFLMRLTGGPHPGDRILPDSIIAWPLPDELPSEGGKYVKLTESQMPPQEEGSHLMRGAEYMWQDDVAGPVMCAGIGCTNVATHTWSGWPTCDDCALPMRATLN